MRPFLERLDRNAERWLLLVLYSFIVYVIFIEVVRRFVLLVLVDLGRGDGPLRLHLSGLDRRLGGRIAVVDGGYTAM